MKQYLELVEAVLKGGKLRNERTGTGTHSIFGPQIVFDMADGFPLVTTKKVYPRLIWVELFWMLSGKTSAQYMLDNNCHIWDEWMDDNNDLGRVYGVQWRNWRGPIKSFDGDEYPHRIYIDQLQRCIDTIRTAPTDRRMLVSAWRPDELDEMALPPCHILYQFYVDGEYLDIKVYQRSADVFLGLPFDIASYATLLHLVGRVTGKKPGRLIYSLGDTHIYTNHVEQMMTQIKRKPYPLAQLVIKDRGQKEIDDFVLEDLSLDGYKSHAGLKGEVSI